MILPDVNVLVYAYDTTSRHHETARRWWEGTLNRNVQIGIPWVVTLGFIRVVTHRSILDRPVTVAEAIRAVRSWFALPNVQALEPMEGHAETLFGLLEDVGVAGNLTTDAHLAAMAIEYHAEVASTDNDFGRFAGVRWFNPLA